MGLDARLFHTINSRGVTPTVRDLGFGLGNCHHLAYQLPFVAELETSPFWLSFRSHLMTPRVHDAREPPTAVSESMWCGLILNSHDAARSAVHNYPLVDLYAGSGAGT